MKKILLFLLIVINFSSLAKQTKQEDSYAFTRGLEAYNEENYPEALQWFESEVASNPKNGEAYYYIGSIYFKYDEYGKALNAINNAIKYFPKKEKESISSLYVSRGTINLELGDTLSALSDFDQSLKLDPKSYKTLEKRAQLYYETDNLALSDADYLKISELFPGETLGFMGIGRNAFKKGDYTTAINYYNKAIRLSPDYANAYAFRGESLINLNNYSEAADDIIKATKLNYDDKAHRLLLTLPKEAVPTFKSKLKIEMMKDPTENNWPFLIGQLLFYNEDYEEAIEFYEKANTIDSHPQLLKKIAQSYEKLQNYNKALEYVDKALNISPEDDDLFDLKADILVDLGKFEEGECWRTKYIEKNPGVAFGYLIRARDRMKIRKYKEAVDDYETLIAIIPSLEESRMIQRRYADALRMSGKILQSNQIYNKIISLEKDSVPNISSESPFAYAGLGNKQKADELMTQILTKNNNLEANDYYRVAQFYAMIDNKKDALKYLHKAFENGYKNLSFLLADEYLEPLYNDPEYKALINRYVKPILDVSKQQDGHNISDGPEIFETVEIPFTKESGVTKVKCTINDLPLYFVFDTGAADVTISMVEANFMLKNDYIQPSDVIGSSYYIDANGNISEGTIINIKKVNFGGLELDNVRASVVRNQKAPLLLGQSVLGRLGKIEIDNQKQKLKITHRK